MKAGVKRLEDSKEFFTEECYILEVSNSLEDGAASIARARVAPGMATRWHRARDTAERHVILEGAGRTSPFTNEAYEDLQ